MPLRSLFRYTLLFSSLLMLNVACTQAHRDHPSPKNAPAGASEVAVDEIRETASLKPKIYRALPGDILEIQYYRDYEDAAIYRLDIEDHLFIEVAEHAEYSREVVVLPDGTIPVPTRGSVRVRGMTVPEVEKLVKSILEKDLLAPSVTISVLEPQKRLSNFLDTLARVALQRPHRFEVSPEGKVSLPVAGEIEIKGLTLSEIKQRILDSYKPSFPNLMVNVVLAEGPQTQLTVAGEVTKPGVYRVTGNVDPNYALALAGGGMVTADLSEVYILRTHGDGQVEKIVVDVEDEDTLLENRLRNISVQGGDLIYVPRSGVAKVDIIVDQYMRKMIPANMNVGTYGTLNGFNN